MLAVYNQLYPDCTLKNKYYNCLTDELYVHFSRSNPRTVSIGHLNTLLYLQLQPIYLIVSKGSYSISGWEILSCGLLHA